MGHAYRQQWEEGGQVKAKSKERSDFNYEAHLEFCEKSHLIRWFHSLEYKEMRALKKAYDMSRANVKGGTR